MSVEITVLTKEGMYIDTASSFAEARRIQKESLPEDLKAAYAGISMNGTPLFYEECLPAGTVGLL